MRKSLDELFWSKVNIRSPDECWEWTGCLVGKGYGGFGVKRKTVRAHRQSWILTHGEIPDGLQVLHKCDNHTCVNPNHLFLGTNSDNMADKVSKGRQTRGESIKKAKLTAAQIVQIRHYHKCGNSHGTIARLFDVDKVTISNVVNHKTWNHVR